MFSTNETHEIEGSAVAGGVDARPARVTGVPEGMKPSAYFDLLRKRADDQIMLDVLRRHLADLPAPVRADIQVERVTRLLARGLASTSEVTAALDARTVAHEQAVASASAFTADDVRAQRDALYVALYGMVMLADGPSHGADAVLRACTPAGSGVTDYVDVLSTRLAARRD